MAADKERVFSRASFYAQKFFWVAIDFVFPPECAACEKLSERLCGNCFDQIELMSEQGCEICGDPLPDNKRLCKDCQHTRPPYERMRSWSVFKPPMQDVLHSLKYKSNLGLGDRLAEPLGRFIQAQQWDVDGLTPVPLSRQRFIERGYNQVDIVAWPLAGYLGLQYLPDALMRVRHTRSQVGLTAVERQVNIQGAFSASKSVAGKTILLMDDVITTGATVGAAARSLLEAGAKRVYAISIARALAKHDWDPTVV